MQTFWLSEHLYNIVSYYVSSLRYWYMLYFRNCIINFQHIDDRKAEFIITLILIIYTLFLTMLKKHIKNSQKSFQSVKSGITWKLQQPQGLLTHASHKNNHYSIFIIFQWKMTYPCAPIFQ